MQYNYLVSQFQMLVSQPLRLPNPRSKVKDRLVHRPSTNISYTLNYTTTTLSITKDQTAAPRGAISANVTKKSPLSFENNTNAGTSFFYVSNPKENYNLCDDIIEITIQLSNSKNKNKTYGGDLIWVWISDVKQKASATADEIRDNLDGTFTAKIIPRWTGTATIQVALVHSSEIVSHLRNFRETYPARYSYTGIFKWPTQNKEVQGACHVTKQMYVPVAQRYKNMVYCNFTDQKTGFPWFCVKPQGVRCDDYIRHTSGGSAKEFHKSFVSKDFVKFYSRWV